MATAEQKNVPKFPDCMEPTGAFKAHDGLITKLATVYERPKIFVSASRGKSDWISLLGRPSFFRQDSDRLEDGLGQ